jgi:hypothetical protein
MKFTINIDSNGYRLGEKHHLTEYRPTPAEEHLPEWFKGLTNETHLTAKTCRGLYDVLTSGYMIVWPFDVTFAKDEGGRVFVKLTRDGERHDLFHPHPMFQLGQYPSANLSAQKFGVEKVQLPYRIKTTKNTSIMMIQPPYRPELKTEVMPGIIDTDKFYTPLNVLFTIKDWPGDREIKVTAGTPLAQIVPFMRTEWGVEYDPIDEPLAQVTQENISFIDRYYQKKLWTRKVFKRKVK